MKRYEIRFTKEAAKDVKKLTPRLKKKLRLILLETVAVEPTSGKRLVGDLKGFYSHRLSLKDRIVYSIDNKTQTIFIHRTRTHYGE